MNKAEVFPVWIPTDFCKSPKNKSLLLRNNKGNLMVRNGSQLIKTSFWTVMLYKHSSPYSCFVTICREMCLAWVYIPVWGLSLKQQLANFTPWGNMFHLSLPAEALLLWNPWILQRILACTQQNILLGSIGYGLLSPPCTKENAPNPFLGLQGNGDNARLPLSQQSSDQGTTDQISDWHLDSNHCAERWTVLWRGVWCTCFSSTPLALMYWHCKTGLSQSIRQS